MPSCTEALAEPRAAATVALRVEDRERSRSRGGSLVRRVLQTSVCLGAM